MLFSSSSEPTNPRRPPSPTMAIETPAPPSPPAPTSTAPPSPPSHAPSSTPYPLIRELALVSLVLTPLILLPYLPLRRRLTYLSQRLDHLGKQNDVLSKQVVLQLDRDGQIVRHLRAEVASQVRLGEKVREDQGKVGGEVERLVKEVRKVREGLDRERGFVRLSPRTLEEIASSFVDVAAFVEEMETMEGLERRGLDPRGIEKMRRLAMNLHAVAQTSASEVDGKSR